MITIRQFLDSPNLKGIKLLTGETSLDNYVKQVRILFDSVDFNGIHDGDLLLINKACSKELIAQISSVLTKKAVLVIDTECHDVNNETFFEQAEKSGFPILMMDPSITYNEILNAFYQTDYIKNSFDVTRSMIRNYFSETDNMLQDLLIYLKRTIRLPVYIVDGNDNIIASTEIMKDEKYCFEKVLEFSLGSQVRLYIENKGKKLSLQNQEILKNTLLALSVAFLEKNKKLDEERRKLVYEIINKQLQAPEIIKSKCFSLNLDTSINYLCIAMALDDLLNAAENDDKVPVLQKINNDIYTIIRKHFANKTIILQDTTKLLVFWMLDMDQTEITKKDAHIIVQEILSKFKRLLNEKTISVGISSVCIDIPHMSLAYNQADQALTAGNKIFGAGSITHFDDISFYRILLEMDDVSKIKHSKNIIEKIIDYDKNTNAELVKTLCVYYQSNFNIKEAANKLYIHYNSIQYRLKKIAEITDLDVSSSEGLFLLMIGLKLKKIL